MLNKIVSTRRIVIFLSGMLLGDHRDIIIKIISCVTEVN